MKKSALLILSCIFIFSSCSTNDTPVDNRKVIYLWHLVKVTGGVSGVDEAFDLETIVWTFNEETKKLVVENNNVDDTREDALDSGTYDFGVLDVDGKAYITINDIEFGNFVVSQNTLIIDQNIMSTGNGADGFVYSFQRTILIEE